MKKFTLDRLWIIFAASFVVFLGLDQASKLWALEAQPATEAKIGFLLSFNKGIVFGMALPLPMIYVLVAGILALGTYLVIENKLWRDAKHVTAIALLLAGAIGNIVDRIRLGAVVDFIHIYWWPTFNLADIYIVLAALFFAWTALVFTDDL